MHKTGYINVYDVSTRARTVRTGSIHNTRKAAVAVAALAPSSKDVQTIPISYEVPDPDPQPEQRWVHEDNREAVVLEIFDGRVFYRWVDPNDADGSRIWNAAVRTVESFVQGYRRDV